MLLDVINILIVIIGISILQLAISASFFYHNFYCVKDSATIFSYTFYASKVFHILVFEISKSGD